MDVKALLERSKQFQLKTNRQSRDLLMGGHNSTFRGQGMAFSELRPYHHGDDVRAIDWNKTAHFNHLYVKVFEEERSSSIILLIDLSASMSFTTGTYSKKDRMFELCILMAFACMRNNDRIGALFFTDRVEHFIPPAKGQTHVMYIIKKIMNFRPAGKNTNISCAFDYLMRVVKAKSFLFLFSDFIESSYVKSLPLIAKKHFLTGIRLFDEKERSAFSGGILPVVDKESQRRFWINTSSVSVREAYVQFYDKTEKNFLEKFKRYGANSLSICTNEDVLEKVIDYFRSFYV